MRIDGQGALVAGGASGLGEATARLLHANGAHVVIVDLNGERGSALASELGKRASFVHADVTSEEAVQAAGLELGWARSGWARRRADTHPPTTFVKSWNESL